MMQTNNWKKSVLFHLKNKTSNLVDFGVVISVYIPIIPLKFESLDDVPSFLQRQLWSSNGYTKSEKEPAILWILIPALKTLIFFSSSFLSRFQYDLRLLCKGTNVIYWKASMIMCRINCVTHSTREHSK